jgi:phosphoglycerate dehydrogenase-like enzyme
VRQGGWHLDASCVDASRVWGGTAEGLRVGIYGMGFAGRAFVPMGQGMGFALSGYDPYVPESQWPGGVGRASSLAELFAGIQALVVCAASTPETCNSVSRQLLACLPDGGVVINTARGAIIEQEALFAELLSGRLRAGLDVLEPDYLPREHPVRQLTNCILTCHVGPKNCFNAPSLGRAERYALENLRRFVAGEPLQWAIDLNRYDRMT